MAQNLILIGFRSTGKSTLAKILKEKTNRPLVSTDAFIENRLGTSILRFIEGGHSWEEFRGLEEEAVKECTSEEGAIIDCGGGVVERERNIGRLRQSGCVFWLQASAETILERLRLSSPRPALLRDVSEAREVRETLERRTPLYLRASHHTINVDGARLFEAPEIIIRLYPKREET